MNIKFNRSGVPRNMRNNPTLLELESERSDKLMNKGYLHALCTHEVAHLMYAVKLGSPHVQFLFLESNYNKDTDEFEVVEAHVPHASCGTWEAEIMVSLAGRVVEHALTDRVNWGGPALEKADHVIENMCLDQMRVPKSKRKAYISRVEAEIHQHLLNPAFRRASQRTAKQFQRAMEQAIFSKAKAA